jgi:hypothetical protein
MPFLNPKQLVLVTRKSPGLSNDAHAIALEVMRMAPHVKVAIAVPTDTLRTVPIKWDLPSVTVGVGTPLGSLVPPRGAIFENSAVKKIDQYNRFISSAIATPRTAELRPEQRFSAEGWAEFVIVKPLSLVLTSHGNSAKLFRAKTLASLDRTRLPPQHVFRTGAVLVQDFVDTGVHPSKWRVLSLFGEPLYSSFSRSMLPRVDLEAADELIEASVVEPRTDANVQADVAGERDSLKVDPAILDFAKRIHQAFPRIPLLGIDILRRESDGALYALEINAGGNVWHFTSYAEKHRARLGGKQMMINQFGAWKVAAKALVQVVERHAC